MLTNKVRTRFGVNPATAQDPLICHEHQNGFAQRTLTLWRTIPRFVFGLCLTKGSGSSGGGGCCG